MEGGEERGININTIGERRMWGRREGEGEGGER
jgi:hypothetical protein